LFEIDREAEMTVRVGVNGFGRIGRLVVRAALRQNADINDHKERYDAR
jgi:glyceraldehyde-3-phosphate dehydrogenase/erythrose-4-phosphate dehydrogenase